MSYKQLKWLILLIPTITVGVWEYVRHEYLLPYISMDLGNWLTPVIVLFVTFTLLTRFFTKLEKMQEQLRKEREAKAILEERERIARELHDGMAQSLFLMAVKINQLKKITVNEADEAQLSSLRENIVEIHDYVRSGIENLRQPVIVAETFLEKVTDKINAFTKETKIRVNKQIDLNEQRLSYVEKEELFFCLQEAFMNIQKHAQATEVWLEITITKKVQQIIVQDNGVGFQTTAPTIGKGHYGMQMMQERCKRIGWNLSATRKAPYTIVSFKKQ